MRLAIEHSIGETRIVALDELERPVSLFFWRDRLLDPRVRPGDILPAIVRGVDKGRAHIFVELETGETGFFNLNRTHNAPDLGAKFNVLVRAESHNEKSAIVRPVSDEPALTDYETALNAWMDSLSVPSEERDDHPSEDCRSLLDDAVSEAQSAKSIISDGGTLYIESTRGLTAVDIDSSGRRPDAVGLNQAALMELARQVSLRRISGLLVVDLVGTPRSGKATELRESFRQNLKQYGLKQAEVLLPSPFGIMEASVSRIYRPLAEMLPFGGGDRAELGADDLRALAIECFRSILRSGEDYRSSRIQIMLSRRLHYFMKQTAYDWNSALSSKIGQRFETGVSELSESTGFEIRVL